MSAIMKLRQARNVEQIADELEPLAVSLATLADQAQASIKSMEAAALQQAREWNSQQLSAANEVEAAAKNVAQYVKALQQAQRGQLLTLATVAGVSAILAAALSIGLWLWLAPAPQVQNSLDAKAVAEYLRAPILDALKRR